MQTLEKKKTSALVLCTVEDRVNERIVSSLSNSTKKAYEWYKGMFLETKPEVFDEESLL